MFGVSETSPGAPGADLPGTKYIQSHVAEWRCWRETLCRKVSHFLHLALASQPFAFHALVDDAAHQPLPAQYPESAASYEPMGEDSSLMLNFGVIVANYEGGDMVGAW